MVKHSASILSTAAVEQAVPEKHVTRELRLEV